MFDQVDLRKLAEMEGPERAFVSLYVNRTEGLDSLAARERRILALLSDEPDELEHFERSMALLREWLEANPLNAEGLAVFSCWALNFVTGVPLSIEVPALLRIDAAPFIRPLAELRDEYENFVIVAADARATRVFLVTAGLAEKWDQVRGDVKNKVKKGGWSQKRYARRRDNQMMVYAKEVVEVLEECARSASYQRIVLLGADDMIREIEEELPPQLAELVVAREPYDLHGSDGDLIEEAFSLSSEGEKESEERLWNQIRNEVLSHGLGAAGPDEVLKAAAAGRMEVAIVLRDANLAATDCRECGNVHAGTPETCPA